MNGELILYLGKRTLETGLLISMPALAVATFLGILISLLQAVTSIKDMTLGVVVKIAGVGVTLLIAGSWMLQTAVGFTREIFDTIKSITS